MRITSYEMRLDKMKHPILVKEKAVNYAAECLNNAKAIVKMCNEVFGLKDLAEEHLYAIGFTTKCKPTGIFELSHGTVSGTNISNRELFIRLILSGAASFVLIHNHPSGDPTPSRNDILATEKTIQASKILDFAFLDHIIIGDDTYCSLQETTDIFL